MTPALVVAERSSSNVAVKRLNKKKLVEFMTQCIRTALRLLIIFVVILRGQSLLAQTTPVNFEFLSDSNNITDGQKFKLAIVATLEKDWHIYWKGSGESGQPTIINWESPDGFSTSSTSYPVPYKSEAFGLISHTYINEGAVSGTKEIAKIYEAIGFDPDTRTYIEGYEKKPIKWVRIHNLPDHAYFNHSQHVAVGNLECQDCHGPVEEMDVLYQHAELTMGWCIDCHRETEVQMEDNNYYTLLHEQLKEKYKGEPITFDKMGGIECGKCHY